jgi:hypothetical protein
MTTPADIEAFVRAARPPWNEARDAYDWYGACAGLTYRTLSECGGYVPDGPYGSAWLAYLDTDIESTDWRTAPAGAIHYWDYTGIASNGQRAKWGHVTIDVLGGGTDTLSATGHAHEWWNRSAGLISVPAQSARPGMRYVGWSHTYGRRIRLTIDADAPTGDGSAPFNPHTPADLEDIMAAFDGIEVIKFAETGDALYALAESGRMEPITDIKVAQMLRALKNGTVIDSEGKGVYSRAQFTAVRTLLKKLGGVPLSPEKPLLEISDEQLDAIADRVASKLPTGITRDEIVDAIRDVEFVISAT